MSSDEIKSPIPCPENWQLYYLKNICKKIGSGATPTGGQAAYLEKRTNYALVRSQNVFDREFSNAGLAFISDEQANGLKNAKLEKDDILLNITGDGITFGRACLVPERTLPACVNQHVSIIRLNRDVAHPGYVVSYLTHDLIKSYIESFNAGGSRRAITKGHIESFVVPLPPMHIQESIAELLGGIDDRIALLRETNSTLESIAQALFKSWFVDFDPVHANAGTQAPSLPPEIQSLFPSAFVESPLGLVPEGWGVGTIGDLANVKGGFAFKGDSFCHSGVPVIKIKNIVGDGTVDIEGVQYVNFEQAEKSKKFLLNDGDILMAMTGATIGKTGIVVTDYQAPLLNQRVAKFEPKSQDLNNGWLIYTAFQNGFMADQILNAASGSAQANISTSGIESAKLMLPENPSILKAFEDTVSTTFAGWIENHKQTKTLSMLRDTLLPRLISGQLRLPEVEELL